MADNEEEIEGENDNTDNHPPKLVDNSPVFRQEYIERDAPLAVVQRQSSHNTPPTVTCTPPSGHLRAALMHLQELLSHFFCACSPFSSLKWAAG